MKKKVLARHGRSLTPLTYVFAQVNTRSAAKSRNLLEAKRMSGWTSQQLERLRRSECIGAGSS
jgi:hypothetical protein